MAIGTVVFVPGFLGSVLGDPPFLGIQRVVWVDPIRLLTGNFPRLGLPVEGEAYSPPGLPLIEGYPLPTYYGLLCTYLSSRGWKVVSPHADWRRSLLWDALTLATLIRDTYRGSPLAIVCHSRGGLVTRLALKLISSDAQGVMVDRVCGLGVPHEGSLNAAINLAGWGGVQRRLASIGNDVFPPIFGRVGLQDTYRVMRSWPALYELLPPPSATWLTAGNPDDLFDPTHYARSPMNVIPPYLTAARAAVSQLPPVPSTVTWTDFAGVGRETAVGVPDVRKLTDRGSLDFEVDGDGTVALASAHQGNRRLVTSPTQHDLLCTDARLWPLIHTALASGLAEDVSVGGPMLALSLV